MNEEKKVNKKNIAVTCLVVFAVVIIILTTGLFVMKHVLSKTYGQTFDNPGIERISEVTGVRFPRSAKLWNSFSYTSGAAPWMFLAQIEINKSDVEEFISLLPKVHMRSDTDRMSITDNCYKFYPVDDTVWKWWKPDSAKKFIALRVSHLSSLGILISMDDPQRAVIYVICTD
ncbi:MAG: hypothetical protein ACYC27_06970 [Armatimonadota bacterium]